MPAVWGAREREREKEVQWAGSGVERALGLANVFDFSLCADYSVHWLRRKPARLAIYEARKFIAVYSKEIFLEIIKRANQKQLNLNVNLAFFLAIFSLISEFIQHQKCSKMENFTYEEKCPLKVSRITI